MSLAAIPGFETESSDGQEEAASAEFCSYLQKLSALIGFESGTLFLVESQSQTLKQVASVGDGIDFISKVNFPMGQGLSAWVAQKGKRVYLPDIHRGSRHGLNPIRSYLSMPLEVNNKVIGVLNLGHLVPYAFESSKLGPVECLIREMTRKIYNRSYLNYISK